MTTSAHGRPDVNREREDEFLVGTARGGRLTAVRDSVRRALQEFLALPTAIVAAFLLLSAATYLVDHAELRWLASTRAMLQSRVFADGAATADLLGTIAGGIITVTSITISVLLLALQQSAATLSSEVFDQFLRRRHNQLYFGFFVGLSLFALLTLATVNAQFNPVFGASLVFALTAVALYSLPLLLYTTINQMRPADVVAAILAHTLTARDGQRSFVHRTRRRPQLDGAVRLPLRAGRNGVVTHIDLDAIGAAAGVPGDAEVVLHVSIGAYVAFHDTIGEVRASTRARAEAMARVMCDAVRLEREGDLTTDPVHGIQQLATIGWTSISTAKSNPAPGLLTIRALRDLLAHWSAEENEPRDPPDAPAVPLVYVDTVWPELMDAFESLAVVASESMQHQSLVEVLHALTVMFDRLPAPQQARAEDLVCRTLPALGDHVLTATLDDALSELARTLSVAGRAETAAAVSAAQGALGRSVGVLGSRGTRAAERV